MSTRPPRVPRSNAPRICKILSAGVIPVRWDGSRWLYLLLRAFQYWDFPKGRTEAGETPLEAALREVKEETGIDQLEFRWGYEFIETGPYARGKVARYYIAETLAEDVVLEIVPELGRAEHHEFRWMTFQEAYHLVSPRVRRVLEWSRRQLST
jgi:bis(5'-nucleosidyl)-tetraphosphatase